MIQIKRHQRGCIGHVQKTKHLIWLECRLQRKNGCVQPFKVAKALLMLQEVVFLVLAKGAGCGVFLWFLGKREMGCCLCFRNPFWQVTQVIKLSRAEVTRWLLSHHIPADAFYLIYKRFFFLSFTHFQTFKILEKSQKNLNFLLLLKIRISNFCQATIS